MSAVAALSLARICLVVPALTAVNSLPIQDAVHLCDGEALPP